MSKTANISYRPHLYQAKVHQSPAKFRVVAAGRQSGKTALDVAEIASWGLEQPEALQLWWVTQSYRVKDKAWRELLRHLPKEVVRKRHEGELYLEIGNGTRIYIKSADAPESLVSESVDGLICDEVFSWRSDVWQDYLRPTIGARPGARVVFSGSPRGRNWAYRSLYLNGINKVPGWASFRWRSDQSPYFSNAEFEAARRELPEIWFRQNYLAEFLEQGGDVFRNVDVCSGPLARPDDYTVIGADLARVKDFSVFWAMNSRHETVEVQRLQNLDWSIQRPRLIEMFRRLKARRVILDATGMHVGADAVVNDLTDEGLYCEPVTITSDIKRAMIEGMMVKFDQIGIRIPKDEVITDEFKDFEYTTLPSGRTRFAAPEGQHDDTVMACGLAEWGLRHLHSRPRATPKSEEEALFERIVKHDLRPGNNPWAL